MRVNRKKNFILFLISVLLLMIILSIPSNKTKKRACKESMYETVDCKEIIDNKKNIEAKFKIFSNESIIFIVIFIASTSFFAIREIKNKKRK